MFAKKTVLSLTVGALLASAVPAFAHDGSWQHRHRFDRFDQRVVAVPRPVYQPAYGPQPVYGYGQPVYSEPVYAPAPVYAERDNTAAMIGGAAVGAFIGSQIGYGPDRTAAVAAGALIGGLIGSNFR